MALSATFTANFSSFYDAVDKADAKLKDFGTGADKVSGRLDALANQFSGRKIVQEATIMAKAVEDIGGVSKLTERELERLGATANEAVAKMKALGMDVPKNLQEIADKTKGATQATTDWMGSLTKVAGAIGIAFSLDAIRGFIGSVFDAADAIKNLSSQWGFSTDAVQEWSGAAKAAGVDTATLGKSIQFFTEQLAEGSKEYKAQLANVGLSYDKLRQMPLEDAYKQIIEAISQIKDGTLQLDVAQGLVGDSAKRMIGAIKDGLAEATAAQDKMSTETIQRLADAEAAWGKLADKVVIYTGEVIAAGMQTGEKMTSSWKNFFGYVASGIAGGAGLGVAPLMMFDRQLDITGATMKGVVSTTEEYTVAGQKLGSGIKTNAELAADAAKKEAALKKAQADRAKAMEETKRRQDEYNASLRTHNDKILDLVNTFEGKDLIGKANLYLEALKDSIPVSKMTRAAQDQINQVMVDAIKVYDAAGEDAPQALYDMWWATKQLASGTADYTDKLGDADAALQKLITNKFDPTQFGTTVSLGKAPKEVESFEQSIHNLAEAFAQLAQISDGAFGAVAQGIATVTGAMDLADKSIKTFQTGLASFRTGNVTQGFAQTAAGAAGVYAAFQSATTATGQLESTLNGAAIGFSVAGPYGAAVGAAVGYIKGLYNTLRENQAVRNSMVDFINAAGGADALARAAERAGVSLNAFYRATTRDELSREMARLADLLKGQALQDAFIKAAGGIDALSRAATTAGINLEALFAARSADEVTQAIQDIQEALQFQDDAMQTAIETAQRYGFTLEELGPAMQRQELDKQAQQLYKDWEILNAAGIDHVAITERMSESVNAYFQRAMRMGIEIPEAMRPMLEAMAKSGKLLDENGNAISDLDEAGVSFTMSMSDGFKKLIDQVQRMTEAIARALGITLDLGDQIRNVQDIDLKISKPTPWTGGDKPGGPFRPVEGVGSGLKPMESYQGGTDGFKNFGAGTPVMLHGWEAVVPREESSSGAFATVSGGPVGGGVNVGDVTLNIQTPSVDEAWLRRGGARQIADAVATHLGRTLGVAPV